MTKKVPEKTVARISLYRRILRELVKSHREERIYSHQLADIAGVEPSQVRRDIMYIGYKGVTRRGYVIPELLKQIDEFFNYEEEQVANVILVGCGNIGRALLSYFNSNVCKINILAVFDNNPKVVGTVQQYRHCYDIKELKEFIAEHGVKTAILALPKEVTQEMADKLVSYGIKGFLNFASIKLNVPENVFVENVDITMHLEKVLFFVGE